MKLRAFVVVLMMSAFVIAIANCGSDSADMMDAGTSTSTSSGSSGLVAPRADGSPSPVNPTGGCTKLTCVDLQISCGPAGDGCGGVIQCGTCSAPETCGGGGKPSVCGGAKACVPASCETLGINCGPAGDGCGGTLDCKSCTEPQICGGGGPSRCGGGSVGADGGLFYPDGGACQRRTSCSPGECGPVADGCGGLLTCGMCSGPGEICGLNAPSHCGTAAMCPKTTCTEQGANCGFVADGCGGILDCGGPSACASLGQICGGGGPNKCGSGGQDGGTGCTNFCLDQLKNEACVGGKTSVFGTVYAPNGKLPIPDALVYVPNGSKDFPYGVGTFTDGVVAGSCDQCSLQSIGTPLVGTKTAANGTFKLDNVPPGVDFPLVIQLGRWRRLVTVSARTACTSTPLTTEQTRLPKRQAEGNARDNIPLLAVSTGSVDALECVLLKLGVDQSEFSNPAGFPAGGGGTGRIQLYQDMDSVQPVGKPVSTAHGGAKIDGNTPRTDVALTNSLTNISKYDAVIFGCPGDVNPRPLGIDTTVKNYADRGGRVYATHYNYTYIFDTPTYASTATKFGGAVTFFPEVESLVNTSFPKGLLFSQWLGVPLVNNVGVGALSGTNPPRILIDEARNDVVLPVSANAQAWITKVEPAQTPGTPLFHYTFNTPVGSQPPNQCGRFLFSDFHVTVPSASSTRDKIFPSECDGGAAELVPQEKILAFFLFDLTACIVPDVMPPQPTCTKLTCDGQNIGCGMAGDGCGGTLKCKDCGPTQVCRGTPATCMTPACTPTTCEASKANCGMISNGCDSSIDCGLCPEGSVCGGSGPNRCGSNTCTPTTCEAQKIRCGPAGNGCGAPLDCGPCPTGETCGGGGVPYECGAPGCKKRTCAEANNANCGPIADGCGGLVECGVCPSGQTCGVDGIANHCGGIGIPQ